MVFGAPTERRLVLRPLKQPSKGGGSQPMRSRVQEPEGDRGCSKGIHICTYTYVCVQTYTNTYMYIYTHKHTYMHIYIYTYTHVLKYIFVIGGCWQFLLGMRATLRNGGSYSRGLQVITKVKVTYACIKYQIPEV